MRCKFLNIAAFAVTAFAFTIDDFSSVKDVDSWEAASQNTNAMMNSIIAANSSSTDRVVLIPAGSTYYMTQVKVEYLKDVTIQIDGTIRFSNEMDKYEDTQNDPFLEFSQSEGIRIQGTGLLDGQGLNWWRRVSRYNLIIVLKHRFLIAFLHSATQVLIPADRLFCNFTNLVILKYGVFFS